MKRFTVYKFRAAKRRQKRYRASYKYSFTTQQAEQLAYMSAKKVQSTFAAIMATQSVLYIAVLTNRDYVCLNALIFDTSVVWRYLAR